MNRVVITGLGVVSPNGIGLNDFSNALKNNTSGIRNIPALKEASFECQVGGIPPLPETLKQQYFTPREVKKILNTGMIYGVIAGIDAWTDAGLERMSKKQELPDWDSGCIFGVGSPGLEMMRDGIHQIDDGNVKKLGGRYIQRTMTSGISAHLGGVLGLGNQVSTNSSACNTGTEAILMAYHRIKSGQAKRMLAGGCDGNGTYIWGGFDSMQVKNSHSNENPTQASRPLSASRNGFIPGSGAGAMLLESLESAQQRGAKIYAEILGGCINSGGQRGGGSMTFPNLGGTEICIKRALADASVSPDEVSAISGHLTGTKGDVLEIEAWVKALERSGKDFPPIQALKSMIGHCLGGAGAIECVAVAVQLYKDFFHASLNCEDLDEAITEKIDPAQIPQETINQSGFKIIAKASFGFGDVNSCAVFRKWEESNN